MDPQRRLEREIDRQRDGDRQSADDQGQKGRGTVTDIIAPEIESAGAAARREGRGAREQRPRAALGAETEKGSAPDRRLPFLAWGLKSEEHTSELQSLMSTSYG